MATQSVGREVGGGELTKGQEWHIDVDPARMDGMPCISNTRIPAELLAELWRQGTWSMEKLCGEYGIEPGAVLVSCWYMAFHSTRSWRQRWGPWAKQAHMLLWEQRDEDCPLPPRQEVGQQERG